jgi:hypothetical protein
MSNSYFDEMDEEDSWVDQVKLPLTKNGLSHKLQNRLFRAKRNGGNAKAIMKNHAPHQNKPRFAVKGGK